MKSFGDNPSFPTAATRSRVAPRIAELPPSPIRRFFDLVEAMPDAISLSIGEPDFVTPWAIREAAIFAIEKGQTHYTPNRGTLELRQGIAHYLASRFGLEYDPATEILVTVGASEGIDLALRSLVEPDDQVLVVQPCYVSYVPTVMMAGGQAVTIPTGPENDFKLTASELGRALAGSPGARTLMLGYPNNPTGAIMRREDLEPIARMAVERDLLVISDEIYAELTYDGPHASTAALTGMRERTLLLSGFSKAFAMTGWRLGYACGPSDIIAAMTKIHGYTMLSAPVMAQKAATEALRRGEKDIAPMRREYDRRRRVVVKRLNEMGLSCFDPRGAFYAFPSIRITGMSSWDFADRLLAEEKVAVVPGSAFGECGEGHIRCSYATSMADLEEALARIARFVERHR